MWWATAVALSQGTMQVTDPKGKDIFVPKKDLSKVTVCIQPLRYCLQRLGLLLLKVSKAKFYKSPRPLIPQPRRKCRTERKARDRTRSRRLTRNLVRKRIRRVEEKIGPRREKTPKGEKDRRNTRTSRLLNWIPSQRIPRRC